MKEIAHLGSFTRQRRGWSAGLGTLVAVLASITVAILLGRGDDQDPARTSTDLPTGPVPILVEDSALSDVLRARFVPAPDGRGVAGSRWVEITVSAPSTESGQSLHAQWQAYLVQAAMAEKLDPPDNLRQAIAGSTILVKRADGKIEEVPGGSTDAPSGITSSRLIDRAALADSVRAAAAEAGLRVDRLSVATPLGAALDLAVTAADPAFDEVEFQEFLRRATAGVEGLEGLYVEVRGPQGQVVRRVGNAFRGHVGLSWSDPSFRGGNREVLPNVDQLTPDPAASP